VWRRRQASDTRFFTRLRSPNEFLIPLSDVHGSRSSLWVQRATGVELAGAIAEIARQTLKHDFRSIHPEEAQIILMDGAPRVLPPFPEDLANKAARTLAKLGVQVKTGLMVKRHG